MGNAQSELQHIANALSGMAADEKRFMGAVLAGNTIAARDCLMANPNVIFARTKDWQNAWHIAALSGTLEMLEVLHRQGRAATRKPLPGEPTPVNHKNKKGITPLMVAVMAGREQVMQFLMAVGGEVRSRDFYGNTCIHYAALHGHVKILELLLATADAELEAREQAPMAVQQLQQIGTVARILGAGAASQLGVDGLASMLAKGRFVEFRNESGLQPLHFAVWGGNKEAVKVLLRYGAAPNARSGTDSTAEVTCNGGSTALHVAGLRNNVDMVTFLLECHVQAVANANPANPPTDPRTIKDNYNYTPYQLAKNLMRDEVLTLLDPRGKLPDIDTIRTSASAQRLSAIRKTTGYTPVSSHHSARSSDDGSHHFHKSASFRAMNASAAATNPATPEEWDPFGTGATAVPALPPPPKTKSAGAAGGISPPAKGLPPVSPPPRAATTSLGGATPTPAPPAPAAAASASTSAAAAGPSTPPPAPASSATAALRPTLTATPVASASSDPPKEFLCPITNQVMGEPVIAADGRTYERTAIEMWLDIGNAEFPGGGSKVTSTALEPNDALRQQIYAWLQQQPLHLQD